MKHIICLHAITIFHVYLVLSLEIVFLGMF